MRWAIIFVAVVHGLIHFMGPVKAFGLRELPELSLPISPGMGVVWLLAGLVNLASAWLLYQQSPSWWIVAGGGVLLSQGVIFTSFGDAKYGTIANILLLLGALWGFLSMGPGSFRADQAREEAALQASAHELATGEGPITETELAQLPGPVANYVRHSGALGRPPVVALSARFEGRIRGGPDEAWMDFTARQVSFIHPPTRLFHMNASKAGIPVDVYHRYRDGVATFEARLASLVPLVRASGAEMNRSETVTFFNDLCLLAPSSLVRADIDWEQLASNRVRAHYALAGQRVTAELVFDERGWLTDFVSDDRSRAVSGGRSFERVRWSTPVRGIRDWSGDRTFASGQALWHDAGRAYPYVELAVTSLERIGTGH